MNLLDYLTLANPNVAKIAEQPISDENQNVLGWNSYVQNRQEHALGGGTHQNREIARRIGIAETFERAFVQKIFSNPELKVDFLLSAYPTTCGFACGFDVEKTRLRSLCEAIERWAWSQWIDYKNEMPEISLSSVELSSLAAFLLKDFSQSRFYQKTVVFNVNGSEQSVYFGVFIGLTDKGLFAGSRVSFNATELWEHSIVEAHRNKKNSELHSLDPSMLAGTDVIPQRVLYFAAHRQEAQDIIHQSNNDSWPVAQVFFQKAYDTQTPEVHLWRTLCNGYLGWHEGDEKRFVY